MQQWKIENASGKIDVFNLRTDLKWFQTITIHFVYEDFKHTGSVTSALMQMQT